MTDTNTLAFEEQLDLTLGGTVEIGTVTSLSERSIYLRFEEPGNALTAADALKLVAGIMRAVDSVGFPEPAEPVDAPAPVVIQQVIPGDDLIFLGIRA